MPHDLMRKQKLDLKAEDTSWKIQDLETQTRFAVAASLWLIVPVRYC